jgi:SUKH-4 immunity protein
MPATATVNFRDVVLSLPIGWIIYPDPAADRGIAAGLLPERDGSLRFALALTFVPLTAPDVHAALLHLIEQIRPTRPGMTDPVASDLRLGELPCEALRVRWSGHKGETQEEFVAMESNDAGERGFLIAGATFAVGDHEARSVLDQALRTLAMRAPRSRADSTSVRRTGEPFVVERGEAEFWGDALAAWPDEAVAGLPLTGEDARYLTGVGLPSGVDWSLTMSTPAGRADVEIRDGLPLLAHDGPVPIAVDRDATSRVVALEPRGPRVVNSSVPAFGRFLMLYQDYRLRVRGLSEQETESLIDEVAGKMRAGDPFATDDPEGYWPIVIEQMRQGLL